MSELRDLYQEVILDHNRRPRNYGALEAANHTARGHNPLCGDKLTLHVLVQDDRIVDLRFEGSGCAISKASASLMTDSVKGLSVGDADRLFEEFHRMVTGAPGDEPDMERLGKLAVLSGITEFPTRVKCASLPWHTLEAALHRPDEVASTESDSK